ncbi:glycosyltransferase family 87 protein [Nocardioides sp. Leaf374]|uniref:glycosyltransferase family 87 protein n=1 Tax=Nocardioides sp. Leaf374 TaxID=2876560 RepID=UPI001E5AF812|nr:glycosyltransferase 87 family protein [Nocardioides sp. Leaf374]
MGEVAGDAGATGVRPLDGHVHPTRDDAVARALSEGLGGPVGEHAGRHRWWTPVRVLLALTAVCFALGMVQKSGCFERTWQDNQAGYAQMCYSDLPYLYTGRGLVERAWPYSDDPAVRERFPEVMEYPVGISYLAYGTSLLTQAVVGWPDLAPRQALATDQLFVDPEVSQEIRWFMVVSALVFAALALLTTWFVAGTHRRRPWDAAMLAASPTLLLTGLINWDLLAVALTAGAVWAWSRERPVLTGVMVGLGTAAKLYPLFLLGGVLVVCLRQRRYRELAVTIAVAVAAWLVANLPALLTGPEQWRVFWSFNSERGPDLGSLWLVARDALDTDITAHTVNVGSWLFFGAWCLGVLVLGLRAPQTPRLAQLGFLVVVGFLLVNKVYSPQYVLWLLPLAVLARPRWRDQVVWQGAEILYFASVWWYLGGYLAPGGGGDAGFYWVAIVVRVAGELYLTALVVRDVLRPERDPVRAAPDLGGGSAAPGLPPGGGAGQETTTRSNDVVV